MSKKGILLVGIGLLGLFLGSVLFSLSKKNTPQPMNTVVENVLPLQQRFILMGDAGTALPVQYEVAAAVSSYCQTQGGCTAAFIPGDVIYNEGVTTLEDEKFQTHFEQPYSSLDFPFYIAFGNHDYLGCTECYIQYSSVSPKWKMPSRYYVQDFDAARFIVIDTENFDQEQQGWLIEQLSERTVPHTIVVGHRPVKTDEFEKHTENWSGKQELTDIICTSADYYVSGHAHILEEPEVIDGCSVQLLVSGTAGSSPRQVVDSADSTFHASVNGFLVFDIYGPTLSYAFLDKDGQVLHTNN